MRNEQEMTTGERVFILTLQPESECVNIYGRDITARMEAEKRLRHISNHDMLTGLPNRALFLDRLDQALGHARRNEGRGAVLLIDLDNFKDVNDTLGHAAGDALLQATADRLAGCVGETDTLARLGGDEFAIILVDLAHAGDVAKLAQKIVADQARPFAIDGRTIHSSASVGVMVYSDGAPGNILRGADVALYRAKGEGRGTYRFFDAGMNAEVQRRQSVEDDIRLAIERGQFVLFYQPKLNLKTNRVEGLEALIRWQHPDLGLLAPGEFIPIAERSKLIVPMGNWVIREACTQNKAWQDAGLPPMKVAVNLSAVQFRRRHLKDHITKVLDDTGLEPNYMELEITESIAMDEARTATMDEMDGIGVSLSLDDFGTGYSNLSCLHEFPLRRVKIDKAFVENIGNKSNTGSIARAVISLGHSLGIEVTAEGVETERQQKFLADLGCDEIQGFHFCRPMPAPDVLPFLERHGS